MENFIRQVLYKEVNNAVSYLIILIMMSIGLMKVRDYYVERENSKKIKENQLYGAINSIKYETELQNNRISNLTDYLFENDDCSLSCSEKSSNYSSDETYYEDTLSTNSSNSSNSKSSLSSNYSNFSNASSIVKDDEMSKNDENVK